MSGVDPPIKATCQGLLLPRPRRVIRAAPALRGTAPTSRRRSYGWGFAHEADPRDQIRDYLLQGVERGTVQDRTGVVAALQKQDLL